MTIKELHELYENPVILTDKFKPLYGRIEYLFKLSDTDELKKLKESSLDLVNFINDRSTYYSEKIKKLIIQNETYVSDLFFFDTAKNEKQKEEYRVKLIKKLRKNKDEVIKLVIELAAN